MTEMGRKSRETAIGGGFGRIAAKSEDPERFRGINRPEPGLVGVLGVVVARILVPAVAVG